MQARQVELARALPMPDAQQVTTTDWIWMDERGDGPRAIPARLHWPATATPGQALPLVVFSHGLGGSREGYSYLGRYWAAHGYASLHLQHPGSDHRVWDGPTFALVSRLQQAAQPEQAQARALDVRFALDRMIQGQTPVTLPFRIDAQRIAMAGHSYGANTSLLIAGARLPLSSFEAGLRDNRIRALIVLSAPPFYGLNDFRPVLQEASVPALHITATDDAISIPGYESPYSDRLKVFDAYGASDKTLVVFQGGSHSVFTDRLRTGGDDLNPRIKQATQELTLEFLQQKLGAAAPRYVPSASWLQRHGPLLAPSPAPASPQHTYNSQ